MEDPGCLKPGGYKGKQDETLHLAINPKTSCPLLNEIWHLSVVEILDSHCKDWEVRLCRAGDGTLDCRLLYMSQR